MAKKIIKEAEIKKAKVEEVETEDYDEITLEDRITSIEAKVNTMFWLVIVILALVVITLIVALNIKTANNDGEEKSTNETTQQQEYQQSSYDTSDFEKITAQEIASKSKNKTIVLWIGRQGCGYCGQFAPLISQAGKNFDIPIYYIDLETFIEISQYSATIIDAEAYETLESLTSDDSKYKTFAKDNLGGTPLTLIIKNNKVIGGIGGYVDTPNIEAAFKEAGLKK